MQAHPGLGALHRRMQALLRPVLSASMQLSKLLLRPLTLAVHLAQQQSCCYQKAPSARAASCSAVHGIAALQQSMSMIAWSPLQPATMTLHSPAAATEHCCQQRARMQPQRMQLSALQSTEGHRSLQVQRRICRASSSAQLLQASCNSCSRTCSC